MSSHKTIQVFEYDRLVVEEKYGEKEIEFKKTYLENLARYLTRNQVCPFYTLYYDRVKFNQYVGVIQVDDLTIEVLPKTDRHNATEYQWQQALIKMLHISLEVNAKTTTQAAVNIKKLTVLEAYLALFIEEVNLLMHQGLIKKYHQQVGNQTSLKGRLLIHHHVSKNLIHGERFYVANQVYDRNNVYNSILKEALDCINRLSINSEVKTRCSTLLLDYPECDHIATTEKLFKRLRYDRKTERYKTAIELAKIILLNYHPDFSKGGSNILAIMVDMNKLWENYIYYILKKACNREGSSIQVYAQQKELFWHHPEDWSIGLKPDLILEETTNGITKKYVLDTKWKYRKDTTVEDVRQMYAYNHYFITEESYLLYPDQLGSSGVLKLPGDFYEPGSETDYSDKKCGLMYVDLLDKYGDLNLSIGSAVIDTLLVPSGDTTSKIESQKL